MKTTKNKGLLITDLLICSVWAIFVWHFGVAVLEPTWAAVIFLLYPTFLRLNISFMLFRDDKHSVWSVLTFILLSVPGILAEHFIRTIDRMVYYILLNTDLEYYPSHLSGHDWFMFDSSYPVRSMVVVGIVLVLAAWIWLLPILRLVIKGLKRRLKDTGFSWYTVWLGYYQDPSAMRYFTLFGLVWVAFLIGIPMPYYPSLLATWILPCAAFYLISRYSGHQLRVIDWVSVAAASVLIWYSQYTMNIIRAGMLLASAMLIFYASYRLWKDLRNLSACVFAFVLCGFVLPLLSIGYNVYSVLYAKREYVYSYPNSQRGVLRIASDIGVGLRDRYGIIIRPMWKELSLKSNQHGTFEPYIVLKGNNGITFNYDYLKRSYDRVPSSINEKLEDGIRTVLIKTLKELDAGKGTILVMETKTGRVKSMVRTCYNSFVTSHDVEEWNQVHKTALMYPISLLAVLESGKASMADVIASDSPVGLARLVGKTYENEPMSFWYALRRLGYGQPYIIPHTSIKNPVLTSEEWTDSTSVMVSLGYDRCLAPFQFLALYNALGNGGCLIVPQLNNGKGIVINEQIASPKNIETIKTVLGNKACQVMQDSTACPVAGMFSTNVIDTGGDGTESGNQVCYLDFCGYTRPGKERYTFYISIENSEKQMSASQLKPLIINLVGLLENSK